MRRSQFSEEQIIAILKEAEHKPAKGLILKRYCWWAGAELNCRHEDFQLSFARC
jgi:hypothetical protein